MGFDLVNGTLLLFVLITSITVLEMRNLFASAMVLALYSFLMSLVWLHLDAPDVALTEAAVGAGISTILLVGALTLVGFDEKKRSGFPWLSVLAVTFTAGALIYGSLDLPRFGVPDAPAHEHVAPEYITQTVPKIGMEAPAEGNDFFAGHVPNLVTSVIVDYRAYDTLFETVVIFTAAVAVILLLRKSRENRL
jgi:multicomponent Na+:H+ antiporter subunit B